MLTQKTFTACQCDNCGKVFDDGDYGQYWPEKEDVLQCVDEAGGWHITGDKHYCPDCWFIGDDDEVEIITKK